MLQATKATTVADFHLQALEVRSKELDYFLMVFDKMSSISSFLAGFASSALMLAEDVRQRDLGVLSSTFLVSTATALGAHLLVVMIATMCSLWGPGKALKGSDATAVDYTLYVLDRTQQTAMGFFYLGLFTYAASAVVVVWLLFNVTSSSILTGVLALLGALMWHKSMEIYHVLQPDSYVSGRLKGTDKFTSMGQLLGDASLRGDQGFSVAFATTI